MKLLHYLFGRSASTLSVLNFYLVLVLIVACGKKDELVLPDPDIKPNSSITIGAKKYTIDSMGILKIDEGIKYIVCKLKNPEFPLVFYTLEFTTDKAGYNIQAWKGKDSYRGLERPSAIAKRKSNNMQDVIMAINGGFYGMSDGSPVGVQIVNGIMINSPRYNEQDPAIGFDANGIPYIDYVKMNSKVSKGNQSFNLSKVNRPRLENDLVAYNSYFGSNTQTNVWGCELLVKPIEGEWENLSNYKNVRLVVENKVLASEGGSMSIPKGKLVLSGHGKANEFLESVAIGEELIIDMGILIGESAMDSRNMISTHNIILKNNTTSNLTDAIAIQRHPRTAVGYSSDKSKIYFIVVNGRNTNSKGVTTKELADIFKFWGASDAVNLDGGGSSCMVMNNKIVNRPSDANERAVSDGLLIIRRK